MPFVVRYINVRTAGGVRKKRESKLGSGTFDTYANPTGGSATPARFGVRNLTDNVLPSQTGRAGRLQSFKRTKRDNFYFQTDTRFVGTENESLTDMVQRGHSALYHSSLTEAEWNSLPATTDLRVNWECGSGNFPGVVNCFSLTTTPLQAFANTFWNSLPYINSAPINGKPNGAAEGIVKWINFNIEPIEWDFGSARYNELSEGQKDTAFYNYRTGTTETIRQCYARGGNPALMEAWQQKYNNVTVLALKIQKLKAPGAKVTHGDLRPIGRPNVDGTMDQTINGQFVSFNPADMLTVPFDQPNAFPWQALNKVANGGVVTAGGNAIDVSGNIFDAMDYIQDYTYEGQVRMSQANWNTFKSITSPSDPRANVDYCYGLGYPDFTGPYDQTMSYEVYRSIQARKGGNWLSKPLFFYNEAIYEFDVVITETGQRASSLYEWVFQQRPSNAENDQLRYGQKYYLHPGRIRTGLWVAWFEADGYKFWDAFKRIDPATSDPRYSLTHLRPFSILQDALDELQQWGVPQSGTGVQRLTDNIPIFEASTGNYVSGNPQTLFRRSRAGGKWDRTTALPLVLGKKKGTREIYMVYAPLLPGENRIIRWKATDGTILEYDHAFDKPGIICYDSALGGAVPVLNNPPSVTISSPTPNQVFTLGQKVVITGTATDNDGTVTKLQFFAGSTQVGERTTSGSVEWTPTVAGDYNITIKATDDDNATTVSVAVAIKVQATAGANPSRIWKGDMNEFYNVRQSFVLESGPQTPDHWYWMAGFVQGHYSDTFTQGDAVQVRDYMTRYSKYAEKLNMFFGFSPIITLGDWLNKDGSIQGPRVQAEGYAARIKQLGGWFLPFIWPICSYFNRDQSMLYWGLDWCQRRSDDPTRIAMMDENAGSAAFALEAMDADANGSPKGIVTKFINDVIDQFLPLIQDRIMIGTNCTPRPDTEEIGFAIDTANAESGWISDFGSIATRGYQQWLSQTFSGNIADFKAYVTQGGAFQNVSRIGNMDLSAITGFSQVRMTRGWNSSNTTWSDALTHIYRTLRMKKYVEQMYAIVDARLAYHNIPASFRQQFVRVGDFGQPNGGQTHATGVLNWSYIANGCNLIKINPEASDPGQLVNGQARFGIGKPGWMEIDGPYTDQQRKGQAYNTVSSQFGTHWVNGGLMAGARNIRGSEELERYFDAQVTLMTQNKAITGLLPNVTPTEQLSYSTIQALKNRNMLGEFMGNWKAKTGDGGNGSGKIGLSPNNDLMTMRNWPVPVYTPENFNT